MKKRAILLGSGGFPIILRLWFETLKEWQNEVDAIYLAIDSWYSSEVKDYIYHLVKQFPKVKLIDVREKNPEIIWPNSYNVAYKESKEDLFLIMHDDCFVYKKGIVDQYFKIAEEGKVVVSKHEIYSPADKINEAINKKYGWIDPPYSFLLYFLFISRANLEKTTMNFNGKGWNIGDDVPLLGIKNSPTTIGGDTGFLLGLELYDKGAPFHYIPRSDTAYLVGEKNPVYHLIQQMKDKEGIFANGWLHVQNTGNTIPLWFNSNLDARDWQKDIERTKLAWMYTMLQVEDYKEIPEFKQLADNVFNGVMVRCGLDLEEIKTISNIFQILLYG